MKPKPVKMWAVRFGDRFYPRSFSTTKTDSIRKFCKVWNGVEGSKLSSWKYWYDKHHRCIRVNVTPEE